MTARAATVVATGLALAGAVFLAARHANDASLVPPAPSRSEPVPSSPSPSKPTAPRPLPGRLEPLAAEIDSLRRSSRFDEAALRGGNLIRELEAEWGRSSPELAHHHHDVALAWKLAGEPGKALEAAASALETWPDDLRLRVLDAVLRADIAAARSAFDARADAELAALLAPRIAERLASLPVRPEELAAKRADMLVRAGRPDDALAAVKAGLSHAPRDRKLRELEAKVHLGLHRSDEALAAFDALLAESPSDEHALFAGVALLDRGDAAAAHRRFAEILARNPPALAPRPARDALGNMLRIKAARALNALGRPREAALLLIEVLALEPENPEALHQLAAAARALGSPRGAEAVSKRASALAGHERHIVSETAALRAGELASARYYRARALASIERTWEALEALREAASLGPRIPDIAIETARIREVLGRSDLAAHALREARRRAPSGLLGAELARVLAASGDVAGARAEIAAAETIAGDPGASVARALLELGDLDGAEAAAPAKPSGPTAEPSGPTAAARLARAEAALRRGRGDLARAAAAEGSGDLPGGAAWAGALLLLVELAEAGPRTEAVRAADPSDLIDHARLLQPAVAAALQVRDPEALAWLERARGLTKRRAAILATLRGRSDTDGRAAWRELALLLAGGGAFRKSREVAHYLVGLGPRDVEAHRALVRALPSDGEAVARFAAAARGLGIAPGDEELERVRREALELLGLNTSP